MYIKYGNSIFFLKKDYRIRLKHGLDFGFSNIEFNNQEHTINIYFNSRDKAEGQYQNIWNCIRNDAEYYEVMFSVEMAEKYV